MPNRMSPFARTIMEAKYLWKENGETTWNDIADRVTKNVLGAVNISMEDSVAKDIQELIRNRILMPGGRYLYASGRDLHQTQNCLCLKAEDTREGWADLAQKATLALMTGAGIGIMYSDIRPSGSTVHRTGGTASGPISLMQMINELGRGIIQGGSRRSAVWAGLHWHHADILKFIEVKNWVQEVRKLKEKDFNFPASLDGTNVSVILDDDFFTAYRTADHPQHSLAHTVYNKTLRRMLKTGEPGFSIDCNCNKAENLRNACTEITSSDDSDVCNLASINLSRVNSLDEMRAAVELSTLFLLAGTVYSHVPYEKVKLVREKNRRLGLGLMGIHEWLLKNNKPYGPDVDLEKYLQIYKTSTMYAKEYATKWSLSTPIKTRALAPNGCQRIDTLITTEDGILTLNELGNMRGAQWQKLNLGVSQENNTNEIATRFFINGYATTKKIILRSGIELEATPNHQYRVLDDGRYAWKRCDQLTTDDLLVVALDTYTKTSEPSLIPIQKQYRTENIAKFPSHMTPKLAWFMGVFYADGSIHEKGIRISCNAKETDYQQVVKIGLELFGISPTLENNGRNCLYVCFNSSMLLRWIYINELDKPECKDMLFPVIIRVSSKESILQFIEGYWFGDGSEGGAKYIDTASYAMAQQLGAVLRAIGININIYTNNNRETSFGKDPMYRVTFIKTKSKLETTKITEILHSLNLINCTVDCIKTIEDSYTTTADIEVPTTNTYIANGLVSHNTIGIVAETSTALEPIYCVAFKRRYLKGNNWHYQYVIDPTAKRLVDMGVNPDNIEDSYKLAEDVERRVAFQVWVQKYVDHAISSTVNITSWESEGNNEDTVKKMGNMLIEHLPSLRGLTFYPDGARGGQPLTPIKYSTAVNHEGKVFLETPDICELTKSGSCGI